MIFKKKKKMSDKAAEHEQIANENEEQINEQEMQDNMENEVNDDPAMDETEQLQKQLDEMNDKYMRLVAEFDNHRKRTARERIELTVTAGKEVVRSLLDVLDDSQRVMKQMESDTDIESVRTGAEMVFHKLFTTLQHQGLKEMECMGAEFDPDLHEAVTEIPAQSEDQVGKILDVLHPGYYLNDKLIRHAKVVVGK